MAKDFNVYQWRREHLNENKYNKNKVESLLNEINERINDLSSNEKLIVLEQLLKHHRSRLNENEEGETTKTIGELTWEDVSGLSLPTNDFGTYMYMDSKHALSNEQETQLWRDRILKSWKDSLVRQFPDALSFEVVIDKSQPSYDQVKILNKDYIDTINKKGNVQQAEFDKYSRRSRR